jgi:predicted nucleic acid-binding protein
MTFQEQGIDRVFCDTSFFYACLDNQDVHHGRARTLVENAATAHVVFYSTWDIVSETVTLLRYHCSYTRALAFLNHVKPPLRLVPYDGSVRSQAEDVFRRLGRDKKLSWCDTISFVVVTMLLNHMVCLSFDRDFKQLGLTVIS